MSGLGGYSATCQNYRATLAAECHMLCSVLYIECLSNSPGRKQRLRAVPPTPLRPGAVGRGSIKTTKGHGGIWSPTVAAFCRP